MLPAFLPLLEHTLHATGLLFLPQANAAPDENELLARLTHAVAHILQHNPQQMAQIAYRLDLPEPSFREALDGPAAAANIAALICRRQYEKWQSRQQNAGAPPAPEDEDLKW